jgi:hypothetical protein
MSSAGFEAEVVPRKLLRASLLSASCAATVAGIVIVLTLPVVAELKALFGMLWLLSGAAEVRALRRGMSRIERICIRSDGSVAGFDCRDERYALRLLPGSVLLGRVGWLRLGFADGLRYGELVTGNAREDQHWRRLLIVWRHRANFGRPSGS